MGTQCDFDATVDTCIEAAWQVGQHGSPEMQSAMRYLLYTVGREIAKREAQRSRVGGKVGLVGNASHKFGGRKE